MIYLDNGATTFRKPVAVYRAVEAAMRTCANPGRGDCREIAGELFHCNPEQVVLTTNCTHGLNIAIKSLVKPGGRVAVSGFEHNAVTRTLHALGAKTIVAGRKLFEWEDTLEQFRRALKQGVDAAVFTHVSNVFGCCPVSRGAAGEAGAAGGGLCGNAGAQRSPWPPGNGPAPLPGGGRTSAPGRHWK